MFLNPPAAVQERPQAAVHKRARQAVPECAKTDLQPGATAGVQAGSKTAVPSSPANLWWKVMIEPSRKYSHTWSPASMYLTIFI